MKLITTFAISVLILSNSLIAGPAIEFRDVNYLDVFELAKQEKKHVLIYFHFDGCGACVSMEKTSFIDPNVAAFYNENFVSLEVNTRKGEGIETNKIYNVRMHPTFIYLDPNGNILHKIVGEFSPEDFLENAQIALDPRANLEGFRSEYQGGNREGEFLRNYCYRLKDAFEVDSIVISEYLKTQIIDDLQSENNIRFIYEFAMQNFNIYIPFESDAFQFLLNNKLRFASYFDVDQVDTRIVWIVKTALYQAIEDADEDHFLQVLDVLKEFDTDKIYEFRESDGRLTGRISGKHSVLHAKMAYHEKVGDTANFIIVRKEYIDKIWDDSDALNSIAWDYYEKFDDLGHLESAKKWITRSVELDRNYANMDTYASILYKLGDYQNAIQIAEDAISIAQQTGSDHHETKQLLDSIKKKLNN